MIPSQHLEPFGNHLIVGVSGTKLNDDDKLILSQLKPVGVIFFAKNFEVGTPYTDWLETFKQLNHEIRECTERESMLMTLDHEGGRVIRTPAPITRFPHAILFQSYAKAIGKATGIELRSLGINISWAPVADVFSREENPIIGIRAFGKTAELAAQRACEYYMGLQESGILGCGKHFPGHGDTTTDSHLELPIVNLTGEDLHTRELLPFQGLIKQGIPLMMTAHILFPQIDKNVPATLSPVILQGILRQKLGFQGVVVSDDLDMKAVSEIFMKPGTVARAIHAGCDLFIISRNINSSSLERSYKIAQDFTDCLNNGELDESAVVASRERITNLLAKTPQYPLQTLDKNTLLQHAELAIACSYGKY